MEKLPEKTYLIKNGLFQMFCPSCSISRTIGIRNISQVDRKITLRIKCICGCIHFAHIERRTLRRKKTNRRGYFVLKKNENLAGALMVKNISVGGAGFRILGNQNMLEINDRLTLGIGIIKAPSHIIQKDALVRNLRDSFVNVEFQNNKNEEEDSIFSNFLNE